MPLPSGVEGASKGAATAPSSSAASVFEPASDILTFSTLLVIIHLRNSTENLPVFFHFTFVGLILVLNRARLSSALSDGSAVKYIIVSTTLSLQLRKYGLHGLFLALLHDVAGILLFSVSPVSGFYELDWRRAKYIDNQRLTPSSSSSESSAPSPRRRCRSLLT